MLCYRLTHSGALPGHQTVNNASADGRGTSCVPSCCEFRIPAPCCLSIYARTSPHRRPRRASSTRILSQAARSTPTEIQNQSNIYSQSGEGHTCSFGMLATAYGLLGCTFGEVTEGQPFCGSHEFQPSRREGCAPHPSTSSSRFHAV